ESNFGRRPTRKWLLLFLRLCSCCLWFSAEPGQNVFLPCKDTDQGEIIVVEWTRTDLKSGFVLLYRDGRIDLAKQLQSYKDRMDLLVNQIQKGDASLVLKNTTIDDSGTYECRVKQTNQEKKRISTVSLVVAPPPPGECLSLDQNQQLPGSGSQRETCSTILN
uniref:Ig-like domain-containing protein n=1 Tax=Xiphophorus maculatus TaxID=8083 RepID=A0A3B5QQE1_XIPMA